MRSLILLSIFLFVSSLSAEDFKGNADTWFLYITDNFDSQSVLEVYDTDSCEDVSDLEPLYIAYGRERDDVQCDDGRCCIERIIRNGEVIAERVISEDGERKVTDEYKTGDTLLQSLGLKAEYEKNNWKAVIDGRFRYHYLGSRTLYGSDKYRFHLTELYAETQKKVGKRDFLFRAGRQSVLGGVLVDGVRSDWLWDADANKTLGLYAGLAPDPRTKNPDHERIAFGLPFHFIPEFSNTSSTKLLIDANLYGELYKQKMNRFTLFSRSHFTPISSLSLFHYSNLELPVPGETNSIQSSFFSLRAFYRPHREWIFSGGLSQFRIDRYLQQESVQYLTDTGSLQKERVGDRLDQSQRYRLDLRVSYKPHPLAQPYIEGRYERRSFDGDKKSLNNAPNTPEDEVDPDENLALSNRKNAYGGSIGLKVFPIASLDTETRFSYNKRFQSQAYDILQEANWNFRADWTADAYFQAVWSERDIQSSIPNQPASKEKATDYYIGIGGSYRFRSDLFGQIRYDFACEDDYSLETNILIHSVLARLNYRF